MDRGYELKSRAEKAVADYEAGMEKLHRPDGTRRYSDAEHKERESALRSARNSELDAVESIAQREIDEAQQIIDTLENGDPTTLLDTSELQAAGAKKAFVEDDVDALAEKELEARLRAVLASEDKASIFCYLQAARRRKENVAPGTLKDLNSALIDGSRRMDMGEARQRIEGAGKAKDLAWALKRGGRTVGAVYARQAYGHHQERPGVAG